MQTNGPAANLSKTAKALPIQQDGDVIDLSQFDAKEL